MNELKQFAFESQRVRVVSVKGEPWFVAKDVCDVLEISNPSDALKRLDEDEHTLVSIEGASNGLPVNAVNESGLYSLVLGSRKPEAKAFKRWITHEVIPAIRQTGSYGTPRELTRLELIELARDSELARLETERQKAELEYQLRRQEPKVALYDVAMQAVNAQPVGTVAKVLNIGPNKLFAWLRAEGILMSHGARYNLPKAEYMDRGYFEVREYSITHFHTGIENKAQTLVTAKGLAWIQQKWDAAHALVAQ